MIFAFWHALLGWGLACLACLGLRRRSAAARCWAWRLGLLKGPLALLLAVPVAIWRSAPTAATLDNTYTTYRNYSTSTPHKEPLDPLPWVYATGVLAVALARLAAARRVHDAMPRVEGVFRPRVVVPEGLAPEAAAMARAHETAHVRRLDPQWSFVADLVCAALWFVPPVWLCARAMRAESEAACDAAALRGADPGAYARLLLDFAGPAPANALGGPARRLARRILMLNRNVKPLSRPVVGGLLALGFFALLPWQAVGQTPPPAVPKAPSPSGRVTKEQLRALTAEKNAMNEQLKAMREQVRALQLQTERLRAQLRGASGAGPSVEARKQVDRLRAQIEAERLSMIAARRAQRSSVEAMRRAAELQAEAARRAAEADRKAAEGRKGPPTREDKPVETYKVSTGPDGTVWRVYRQSRVNGPYQYKVEKVFTSKTTKTVKP